jgi:uncharacterized protein YidB (DUF937 family)
MSIFDTLASSFGEKPEGSTDGSGPGGLIGAAVEFVNNQPGGLQGLIQRFHQEGAGEIVESWIGNGENKEIDPQTLHNVLGSGPVSELAAKAGMSSEQLTGLLSMVLPGVVNNATPNGELPADGKLDASHVTSSLGGLAGLFGK